MSTPTTPPTSLQEEKSRHGWIWRINTLTGIACYSVFATILSAGIAETGFFGGPPPSGVGEYAVFSLQLFLLFMAVWFIMLLPALLLRLIGGGSLGTAGGFFCALLSLALLAILSTVMGVHLKGSFMLYLFAVGSYKLASCHFGLRSLGIPLDLPEWRTMKLTGARTSTGFSFSVFYVCLYWAVSAAAMGALLSFCFDYNVLLHAVIYTAMVLLPSPWASRPCISALTRAIEAYKRDLPEKSLSYSLIWVLLTIGWSGLIYLILELTTHSYDWDRNLRSQLGSAAFFVTTLSAVGGTQVLMVLFRYLSRRYPRHCHTEGSDASTVGEEAPRKPLSFTRLFIGILLPVLAIAALLGATAYVNDLHRNPYKHSLNVLKYLAPQQYKEVRHEFLLPDVDILPSCLQSPTNQQREAARLIAAFFLQEKGLKYRYLLQTNRDNNINTVSDAVSIYQTVIGRGQSSLVLCQDLMADVPQERKEEIKETLQHISQQSYSFPTMVESRAGLLLGEMLQIIVLHRFEHP